MPDFYRRMQFEGVVKTVYTDYTQGGGKRAEAKAYTDPLLASLLFGKSFGKVCLRNLNASK